MKVFYQFIFLSFLILFFSEFSISQNIIQSGQKPIDSVLNADGSVKKNIQGSFQSGGYQLVSRPNEPPRFAKSNSNPKKVSAVFDNYVDAIAVDGSGNIYVGGRFTTPGSHVAMWNGTSWSDMAGGLNGNVMAIAIFNSEVYFGGQFTNYGGYITKWDGSSWVNINSGGPSSDIWCLAVHSGTYLYAGGFGGYFGRYNGSNWNTLGSSFNSTVQAIAVDGGTGDVYVGGAFTSPYSLLGKWNGSSWTSVDGGCNGLFNYVTSLCWYSGKLYVSGSFSSPYTLFAAWNGSTWENAGFGFNDFASRMEVIGTDLYAMGQFTSPGSYIAKFDGSTWLSVGSGTDGVVWGSANQGGNLYVVGGFSTAGGVGVDRIGRYNGTDWFSTPGKPYFASSTSTAITSNQASLYGYLDPNGCNNTTVKFIFGTSAANLLDSSMAVAPPTISGTGNVNVTATASGLIPLTTYYYRLRAWNSLGIDSSAVQSFTTIDKPTCSSAAPTNLKSTSATINGSINPNGDVSTVKFIFGTSIANLLDSSMVVTPSTVSGGPTNVSADVTGLTPGTTYYYRTRAWNAAGIDSSGFYSFTTTPLPNANTYAVSVINSVSATLEGDVNPQNEGTLDVVFRYGTSPGNLEFGPVPATPSTVSSPGNHSVTCNVSGLIPFTMYWYRVGIVKAIGDTIWGSDLNSMTLEAPTSSNAGWTNLTSVSALLWGNVNGNGNGTPDVVFRCGTGTGNTQGAPLSATPANVFGNSPTSVHCQFSGLLPSTNYYYRVGVVRAIGDTIWSPDAQFTTEASPTATVSSATSIGSKSATLNGTVNAMNNGSMDVVFSYTGPGGEFFVPSVITPVSGNTPTGATADITGLTSNYAYSFKVGIIRAIGDTIWSTGSGFNTLFDPIASTQSANSITSNSAVINGAVNDMNDPMAPLYIVFRYGPSPQTGNTLWGPIAGTPAMSTVNNPTPVSVPISGLASGTQYNYKVGIVRGIADTIWGSEMSFTTLINISGVLQNSASGRISGITIRLRKNGADSITTVSGYDGTYSFTVPNLSTYSIAPDSISNYYHFYPDTLSVTTSGSDLINQNFLAARLYTISGNIIGFSMNDTVKLIGSPAISPATLDSYYSYYFSQKIDSNSSYTIQPTKYSYNTYPYLPNTTYTVTNISGDSITKYFKAARLTITSPVSGPSWQPFSIHNIYWNSINTTGTVNIYYSTNGGTTYTLIASNVSYDSANGRYAWTIPNTPSSNCKIKLEENTPFPAIKFNYISNIFTIPGAGGITTSPGSFSNILNVGQKKYDTLIVKNNYAMVRTINQMSFIPFSPPVLKQTYRVIQNAAPVSINPNDSIKVVIEITGDTIGSSTVIFKLLTDGVSTDSALSIFVSATVNNGLLSLNKNSINFGTLYKGRSSQIDTLTLKNNGTTTITLNTPKLAKSPSDFTLSSPTNPLTIAPNATKTFYIGFNPFAEGGFGDTLILKNNSSDNPDLVIPILATVIQPAYISINKKSINFGSAGFMMASIDSTLTIQDTSLNTVLKIDSISYNSTDSVFRLIQALPVTIQPNSSSSLSFRFNLSKIGSFQRTINLFNSSDNEPNVSISLSGNVVGSTIGVSPKIMDFGNIGLGSDPKDSIVTISNTGPYKLIFTVIPPKDSCYQLSAATPALFKQINRDAPENLTGTNDLTSIILDPGKQYSLRVRLNPSKTGNQSDTLSISSNSSNSQIESVILKRNVLPSSLTYIPSALDFGTTSISAPLTSRILIVQNGSATTITVSDKKITGDSASFYIKDMVQKRVLTPGMSDTIIINFQPRSAGSKSATLKITSNDPTANNKYINLTGTGGGSSILSVSSAGIDFGGLMAGQTSDSIVVIRNNGNLDLNISGIAIPTEGQNYFGIITGAQPVTLQSGQSQTVKIRATGAMPLGAKTSALNITSDDPLQNNFSVSLASFITSPIITKEISYIITDVVPMGTGWDTVLSVSNVGNSDLIISKLDFDGPAASDYSSKMVSDKWTIEPGGKAQISIHFVPKDTGNRDASLIILSNDPNASMILVNIRGRGKDNPVISVSPETINFGFVDSNKSRDLFFTIKNIGYSPLRITSIVIIGTNSNLFSVLDRPLPFTLAVKDSQSVKIRYTSSSLIKNPSASIQITSNDRVNQIQRINLTAASQRPYMSLDSTLVFSSVSVGDSTVKNVTITNSSSVYFTIDTIYFDYLSDAPFRIKSIKFPVQVDPSTSYELPVTFNPKSAKSYSGRLNIISYNASNNPQVVKITGNTNKPVISLLNNSIDFKFIELNNFKDTTLSISNSGQTVLRIESMVFSGAGASQFLATGISMPFSIQPGKTETPTIRFLPGSVKSAAVADLRISSSDLDKPQVYVSLTGSGDAPTISSDTVIDFGKVIILDSVKKTIKLNNVSSLNLRIDSISIKSDTAKSFGFSKLNLPLTIGAKGSIDLEVMFKPTVQKNQTAYLNIFSSDKSKNPLSIVLSGSVTTPKMSLTNLISFGKVRVDSNKTIAIKIENTGDGNLSIKNIGLTGKDSSEFRITPKTLPFTILPGKSDSIFIQFNPKTSGIKNASLIVSSNDNVASGTISIDAEGYKQNLIVNPVSINYGDIVFSRSKTDSVILQNIGGDNLTVNSLTVSGKNANQFSLISSGTPFTLTPNGKKSVLIEFRPDSIGGKTASLDIISTDLLKPNSSIGLSGNCISPTINLSVSQLNYKDLRINTSKDTTFTITNKSTTLLILKSCGIIGNDSMQFSVSRFNAGKILQAGESDTVGVKFIPSSTGDKFAILMIKSNDFKNQSSAVSLSGKGIIPKLTISASKIDYGKTFAILTKDSSVSITNSGSEILSLKKVSVTGQDSLKFSASLSGFTTLKDIQVSPGETKTFLIKFSPKTSGVKIAALTLESNDPNNPATSITLTGEGFIPAIILDNDLIANESKDKTISFHLSDNHPPKTITLFYRKGGLSTFDSVSVSGSLSSQSALPAYTYIISGSFITKNGMDFFIKSYWEGAETALPQKNYLAIPMSLQIKLNTVNPVFVLQPKDYSMLTIPLFTEKGLLFEMIRNLGSINNSSWRIFKWRNGDNEEYLDETSWQIGPGDGFWLISKENKNITFENCLTVPTSEPYIITLQPGWNQIGSPFLFNIPAANINIPSGKNVERALWAWNGNDGYQLETAGLVPWTGYFVKNNEQDSVKISISTTKTTSLAKTTGLNTASLRENEWKLQILTTLNGIKNINAEIGCLKSSSDSWDNNDISEPPEMPGKYFTVRFPHPDWKNFKGNYVRDYRSLFQDGKSWEMEIMNLTEGKDGEIKFTATGSFPDNFKIFIYDYDLNKSFRVITNYKFKFSSKQQVKKLKLIIGNEEFINNTQQEKIIPDKFSLSLNYPNPFNPVTSINYQLPVSCYVTLKIYDVLGKEVATLVSENQSAGTYNVTWNAVNVPSGMYFYRLVSGDFKDMKKLMLIK